MNGSTWGSPGKYPPPSSRQQAMHPSSRSNEPDAHRSHHHSSPWRPRWWPSLVIYPQDPHAPTLHANYCHFEITSPDGELLAWSAQSQTSLYEEDTVHFHSAVKSACVTHGTLIYPAFKQWCDEYFHITHWGESRRIGGIFFDDLHNRAQMYALQRHPTWPPMNSGQNLRLYPIRRVLFIVQQLRTQHTWTSR